MANYFVFLHVSAQALVPHVDSTMGFHVTVTFGCFFAGLDAPGRAGKELALLNPHEIQWENTFVVEYEKTIL